MKIVLYVLTAVLALMAWGFFNIWRSPAYYTPAQPCESDQKILTMAEYGQAINEHPRPFVVAHESVVVFGAEHTKDAEDSQFALIRERWESLQPTVALVEGRLGFLIPYAMDPTEKFGESGYVAHLAKADGAALYSWEMPKSELVTRLLDSYTPEQVALQQILTPYFSSYRFGPPDHPESFVAGFLHRAQYPGLNNAITSVDDIDQIWQRDFPAQPDWRETSDQFGLPGYLQAMADDANLIRNQHLLCVIDDLQSAGERVFVICGSSHAVCLEPALE